MTDLDQILAATQTANLSPTVVRTSGAGKAFQSVAQSAAITVQDGSDYLRNSMTIGTTAIGLGVAKTAAGQDGSELIKAGQNVIKVSIQQFAEIGAAAAKVVQAFPSS